MSSTNLMPTIKVGDNEIRQISEINNKDGQLIWDLFEVKTGNGVTCNVVVEHGVISQNMSTELLKIFVFDRVSDLMKKEKKNDCIFLGTLYQKDGKIKMTRHYNSFYCKDGKTAQQMFDDVYSSLKQVINPVAENSNFEKLDDDYIYLWHGSNQSNPKLIFDNGLKVIMNAPGRPQQSGGTYYMTSPHFRKETVNKTAKAYSDWLSGTATPNNYVYVMRIPKKFYHYTDRYGQAIEMPLFKTTDPNRKNGVLINSFVYGMVDITDKKLILNKNSNYGQNYNPEGLIFSEDQLEKMKYAGSSIPEFTKAEEREHFTFEELVKMDKKSGYWNEACQYHGIPYNSGSNTKTKQSMLEYLKSLRGSIKPEAQGRKGR